MGFEEWLRKKKEEERETASTKKEPLTETKEETRVTASTSSQANSFEEWLRNKRGIISTTTNKFAESSSAAYNKAKNATQVNIATGNTMSDEDRETRRSEINSQLTDLTRRKNQLVTFSAGASRGNATNLRKKYDAELLEVTAQIDALNDELDALDRPATISRREQIDYELEDAKESQRKMQTQLSAYIGEAGGRNLAALSDEARSSVSEKYKELNAINETVARLEREAAGVDYVDKYSEKVYDDNFIGQFGANYRTGRITQDLNDAFNAYLNNPTESNREYAYALAALANEFQSNNAAALDDEGAVLPWVTQSAAGHLPQFWDQTKAQLGGGAIGLAVGSLVGNPAKGAEYGASIASGIESYGQMRGAAYRTLLEAGVDEETALAAANDEALVSALIEAAGSFLSFKALGGTKALNLVGNAALKSGSKNAAVQMVGRLFGGTATDVAAKAAAKWAGKTATQKALSIGAGYIGNIASEGLEERLQEGVSIANENRDGTGKLDLVKNAWSELWKDENQERLNEATSEGMKIAAMFGGVNLTASTIASKVANAKTNQQRSAMLEAIKNDSDALGVLIDEGKASGETSVSAQIATEIEEKVAAGQEVTTQDVGRLIAANEVYIEAEKQNTPVEAAEPQQELPETLEQAAMEAVMAENAEREAAARAQREVSGENVSQPTPEEVPLKTAVNAEEMMLEDGSAAEVLSVEAQTEQKATQAAYEAGKANVPREKVNLETTAQEEAYNAGRMDHIADMGKKENTGIENAGKREYTEGKKPVEVTEQKSYTRNEPGISDLSTQLSIRDVATVDGIKYTLKMEQDGKYRLSIDRDTSVMGGYINDARANIYKGGPFETRGEAVQEAIDVARVGKLTKTIKEDVTNGEVAEVFDKGRVLEPDAPRQSDGGLLDGLAAENVQEDARGRDAVSVSERDGREPAGDADRADAERDGGGRSLGSGERADLQSAAGAVNHVPLNSAEELDNAISRGSNFENSKQRIADYYKKNPSPAAAIEFLKKEYGTGGASHDLTDGTRAFLDHDAKGLTLRVGGEKHTFTWKAVEKRIRALVAEGKYLEDASEFKEFDADGNPVFATNRTDAKIEPADHKKIKELRAAANEKFGLEPDEARSLSNYTQSTFRLMNDRMLNGTLREAERPVVDRVMSALQKFPTFEGRTYRNVRFDTEEKYNDFLAKHAAGKTVPLKAFTSTSKRPNGYPLFGDYVAHMVIDGKSGADIADTYSIPRQQEVILLPGTEIEITSVTTANDGHPLIYAQEVATNGVERDHGNEESARGVEADREEGRDRESSAARDGGQSGGVREAARDRHDGDGVLSERGESSGQLTEEAEVEQKTELATQENARGNNFSIPEDGLKLPKGDKARFKANVEAIKTLRTLMAENRRATPAEQEILSKYVGWGGLASAFDEKKADWAKEYKQLKNLLNEKEYASARGSTLNAHYTDVGVIRAIYNGLAGLGFKGGRLLEPSAGVGHFAGAIPQELAGNTTWTMVELDELTGNIAKYLYPNADVRVQGFENAKIPDNYMDMAISNVPFGNYAIVDKSYPKSVTGAIHNYFFAKALDKVRPGGIVAFITSRYTMDAQDSAVRHYIAQRADLLGAIRLPDSAFKGNANTEVVTDILILKKREAGTPHAGEEFENTGWHHQNINIYERTNNYFADHPEMVLGTPASTGSMYRSNSLTYTAKPGNLQKQIEKAFASIKGKMDYPVQRTQEEIRAEIKAAAGKAKNGQIIKKDGKLYRNRDGVLEEVSDVGKGDAEIMSAVVELRDTARKLLDAQLDGISDKQISTFRKALNSQYDAFVKKYGILNSQKNKRLIGMDVDSPFIMALENYDKDTKKATKADIFNKNTIEPVKTVTSVNTVEEGLIVSMNETGGVDAARIAELLGESVETVTRALLDNRMAFKNRDGKLETAEKYLSGNVKAKLRDAEALAEGDPDYTANVEELRKIIPADIPAEDISVQPGGTWIPDSVYSDFVAETLGSRNYEWKQNATVTYNKLLGNFKVTVSDAWLKGRPENVSTWGTPDRSFINIFEATLNSKSVVVKRKLDDGSSVVDKQATAAAQEKQEKIRAEFQRWLWADDTRKETLVRLYNDVFNNYVTPKYDGSNLVVNGSNAAKPMRPHQKDAVHRIVNSGGNTLLAHKVGAGKTYEMAAAAMKLRQLGIVKKPMFVVPKSLVAQWGNEFLDFFPAAKILVLGEKDFSAANRKLFANRIATGDYDAVILSQEQFKAVPMSIENQEAFYQDQITALELTMEETARANGKRDPSIKQMEKSKKSFEAKLKKLGDMKKDEENIDFEQLGVDALFVDEAHSYKNLFYTTNMNNVSGLGNKDGSQKAFDLYMKVRYLQGLNGGRGIVFATATPVMNSMSEMYIMQKYLQSDLLEARGLHSFDAWASQFGEVRTVLEMNPSGKGFRQKQSFSRFKNLAELQQMFRAFADVLTDIPGLKIPTMKEGKRIIVESDPSEFQMDFIEKLAERADAIKNRKVDPKDDNMLKVTSEGRKLSYTQRMIDPSLPYEDGNKIMKCADNVLKIWKETKANKGTQLIFCDLSTPKGSANTETTTETTEDAEDISIYDDIRNVLIGAGVPAKEIAFIHDANTNEKKAKLFKDVNEGTVRVLIGSTGKMGVGMNAQKRIVALHHLDAPWRPGDIEQREGRALRQGNMNEEVGMYVYVTKQTFDSRMWDNLQRKASFIHQVMAGDLTARESEGDGDFALSAAEIKAISSGNPLIMEQFEVAAELSKLENLERAHAKEVADAKRRIEKAKTEIASDNLTIERLRADIAVRQDTSGDKFRIKIGGKTFTERKAAGEALIAEAKKRLKIVRDAETTEEIGSFAGFKLFSTNSGDLLLRGKGQYRAQVNMDSPAGTATRLEEAAKRLDNTLAATETRLQENKASISKLEKTAASSFDKADELLELRKRNAAILAELNPDSEANIAEMGDDGDGDTDNMVDLQVSGGKADQWTASRVGEDKTPMRLSEIVEKIRHDFGINITTGHIRGAGVLGQYDRKNQGIRTKIANDLPTVAHELGHHLDTTYDLTDKQNLTAELKKELIDGLDQEMKDAYAEKKWPREGLAEFIRKYLQNRETAAIDYPKFTKYFLNSLSASDAALVAQLADEVNAYYALDADTATSSIRLREEGNPDARTFSEKIQQKASVLYQAWVDANHGIKLFDEATGSKAYTLANNAAYSDAMAGQIIVSDLTDANGQYVAPGLKTALHGINLNDKTEYRLFGEYLTVKHGPERLAEGMRIFADDRKNSTAFMERRAEELEQKYPQFKEAAERLYQFQSDFLQTWGVNTGLVSKQSASEWADRWEFYVPLNRAVSEEKRGIGAKRGFANQNSTIKRARGSGLDIVHPVDNIVNNIVKMVNAGVRNNVMRTITDSAEKLGANAEFLEKVPPSMVKRTFDMTGVKEQLTAGLDDALAAGEVKSDSYNAVENIIETLDNVLEQYGKGKAYGDTITVLKGGKQEFWKINDPLLLQSITTMSPKKLEGIFDALAVVSRFMTSNITGNNIIWSIFSNFPRDLMTMFTYSKTKNPFKVFKAMGEAYVNKVAGDSRGLDPMYREYLAMGGGNVSAYTADRNLAKNARQKLSGKKFSANPLDWIAFVSETVEMGPRYATYKLLRENGMNPQEAFAGAMDITVNFRRGGRIAREANKAIPFFNVSIQGLDKFRRWITAEDAIGSNRKKVVRSRVTSYIAVSAALAAVFYAINNGDDEDEKNYEQLSNYQKNSYWNIPLGDGKYFAIPKPREIGVLSSFMETAMEYGIGENAHAFDEFYDYASDNLLPKVAADIAQLDLANAIGSIGIIGVGAYMMANRDFLGKPIVSAGLQNLEPKDQYTNRTSKIAYSVGQAFNLSPMMIDYFFQQTLGGFWKYQKALFPVGGENVDKTLGVQGTYVKDNQYTTDLVNWMYDQADKSAKAKNSNPGDMGAAITAKMDSNMTTFYSRFYGISKDTAETNASRGARQTVLDMIREYQKATDSGYTTPAQDAVYAIARRQGSTETLPSVMQTTVKDGSDRTRSLSPEQYVEYQTDYLRLYWEYVESNLDTRASAKEQLATLQAAKEVAMEKATERTLSRIGAPSRDFSTKYAGVSAENVIDFMAGVTMANEDGSVKKAEVVDVITSMDLDNDDAWTLYFSKYESKAATAAHQSDIAADLFMTATLEMDNIKPDYKSNGKEVEGSRRKKVESYLNSVCDTYRDYLFLLAIEYPTVKKDADYIAFFGRE